MADPNVHVHGLVQLGMTRYEAKAYLTLIQRESYAASELANEAGIPRQRIYDVLNSLVSRGLARDWPGPVTPYAMPNNPLGVEATRRIVQNGGDVRCIYEPSIFDNPEVVTETLEFIKAGEGARVAEEVPMKLCLADGHRALFSLTDPIAGA